MNATLVNCPACQQPVSPAATACPRCGQPLQEPPDWTGKKANFVALIILTVIAVALFISLLISR